MLHTPACYILHLPASRHYHHHALEKLFLVLDFCQMLGKRQTVQLRSNQPIASAIMMLIKEFCLLLISTLFHQQFNLELCIIACCCPDSLLFGTLIRVTLVWEHFRVTLGGSLTKHKNNGMFEHQASGYILHEVYFLVLFFSALTKDTYPLSTSVWFACLCCFWVLN